MQIFKRILFILGSLIILLFLAAFIIIRFYEDDVVKYALDRAKTQFNTRVEMGDVELTFWETFPRASLHFSDVFIEETLVKDDTLLFARSVYLEFNLLDLMRSRYDIRALDVEDAVCYLHQNDKGKDNWHFWKTDQSDSSQFVLDLQKINLDKTRLEYSDDKSMFLLDLTSEKSTGKGDFSDKQFKLDLDLEGTVHRLISKKQDFAINKKVQIEASIDADTDKSLYKLGECELALEKLVFQIAGSIDASDKSNLDLKITGKNLDLEDLIGSLTPEMQKSFDAYSLQGDLNMAMNIFGNYGGKRTPQIEIHAVLQNGEMTQREKDITLDNIECELRYASDSKEVDHLKINSFKCNLEDGYVQVHGVLANLVQPELKLAVQVDMEMAALKKFFALDTLEICQGHIQANADVNGVLKYVEADTAYDWRAILTSGTARLENGIIRVKNSNREFQNLQADVLFDKKDAKVQNFSGNVNGSDFKINGALNNLIPFLSTQEERLFLDARLNSNVIDFTNLVETTASTASDNNYRFDLPSRVDFTLNSNIKKFLFRKFEATDVKGIAELKYGVLTVDPVAFNTADGQFKAQIAMEKSNDDLYRLNCLAELKSINIKKLFTEFENFDQDFIQDKHLNGDANATVQFRTSLTTALEMLPDKVESLIDISIENGQLIELESLQEIASYIKGNKWVAPFVNEDKFAEKMRNISFSKLENVIEIKDRMITIPLMDIKSSAMDISARGTHTFDNQIDYAIGFNLRDVLVRKDKEWTETDDGLGKRLYISMKGTTDNPVFAMDKELAKEVRQVEMEEEKQNVKALLKEELGLFKKDKTVGTYKEEETKTGTTTTLEWEGFDPSKEKAPEEKPKEKVKANTPAADPAKDKPKKKVPKWLEEK